jgi:hypothetical protein
MLAGSERKGSVACAEERGGATPLRTQEPTFPSTTAHSGSNHVIWSRSRVSPPWAVVRETVTLGVLIAVSYVVGHLG